MFGKGQENQNSPESTIQLCIDKLNEYLLSKGAIDYVHLTLNNEDRKYILDLYEKKSPKDERIKGYIAHIRRTYPDQSKNSLYVDNLRQTGPHRITLFRMENVISVINKLTPLTDPRSQPTFEKIEKELIDGLRENNDLSNEYGKKYQTSTGIALSKGARFCQFFSALFHLESPFKSNAAEVFEDCLKLVPTFTAGKALNITKS